MAEIVAERDRLGEIVVEVERPRDRARDLRDLDGVGQARAEMVVLVIDEHLRLVREAAERGGMDDPVAIALEGRARRRGGLGVQPPARGRGIGGVRSARSETRRRSCSSLTLRFAAQGLS